MTRRLMIVQALLLAGLSLVFLLPQTPPMREAALRAEMPTWVGGGWEGGSDMEASKEEREILAKDTEFFRRSYFRPVGGGLDTSLLEETEGGRMSDVLNAGIVLSGKDPSNSIHALERCLTAQGFNIAEPTTMLVKLKSGHVLPVRRLFCTRVDPATRAMARSIAYYWFVGHDAVTGNHVVRGIKDFSDRMLKGYDQRWGYITVTAYLDGVRFGDDSLAGVRQRPVTPEQADRTVEEFLGDFVPEVVKTEQIAKWYGE